jgi:POT family proton-dependent oligopeptide transporter
MSQSVALAAEHRRASIFDHPLGFWFFFCGGCAERCSYYGMRAILLLYMIRILNYEDGNANQIMSFFVAGCYLLPLLGGFIADRYLGNYRTIVYFSIPYVIGQGILGIAALHNTFYLFLSLGLLVLGAGIIKPNISTLMGLTYDQRRPGQSTLRSDAFALFYGSINIGSALSMICVPVIRNAFGGDSDAYAKAFLFPTVLMALSFVIFALGKPFYAVETIHGKKHRTPEERRERLDVLQRMLGLFLVVAVFWSIYDQAESTWVLFTRDYLHLKLFGHPIEADQLQTLNPVLILIMLPPITMMWHLLARLGWNLRPTSKMLIGFLVTGGTMAVIAWSAFYGAGRVVAGAPAAVEQAEKAAVAAGQTLPPNEAAESTAEKLIAAVTASRGADRMATTAATDTQTKAAGEAKRAAKGRIEAADQQVKATAPALVAVICARRAAREALHTAETAMRSAAPGRRGSTGEATATIRAGAEAAMSASAAVEEAKDLAVAAAKEEAARREPRNNVVDRRRPRAVDGTEPGPERANDALTLCAVAATQANGAAKAALSSIVALAAANGRAARINAAVAGVDAADAAVAAAKSAAQLAGTDASPAAVESTEEATAAARISLLWQVIPYILMTVAEVCISVVGLELAFAAAPPAMKTFMTACWLMAIFVGNFANGFITKLYNETFLGVSLTPDWYFLWFAVAMVPVTLAFIAMSRRFNQPV